LDLDEGGDYESDHLTDQPGISRSISSSALLMHCLKAAHRFAALSKRMHGAKRLGST